MENNLQAESNTVNTEEIESLNRLKNFVAQGELRMNAVQILSENQNDIVNKTLSILPYLGSESIQQISLNKQPRTSFRSEIFLRCICYISLHYINSALFLKDKKILEQVQTELNLLKNMYFSQGGTNSLVIAAFRQMQAIIPPLINNFDIVTELDSYFEYLIFNLDNQHEARLKKQSQGLAKLAEEWLAEDVEEPYEQEETWNYLRDALNNETLSHRPIPA